MFCYWSSMFVETEKQQIYSIDIHPLPGKRGSFRCVIDVSVQMSIMVNHTD